ncbi:helix-turn-helix transcriptional regulator [Vibrio owensii]|uniref:helix-turn-helix domain-containing protein n=1 Tax=Vibrio owensii TaxID=696485 RepID=UPI0033997385
MFGDLIKKIRKDKGFTQSEMVAHMQLSSDEFSQVDYVTVSRWERGVTTPIPSRALRILRCFMMDVTPFLDSLEVDDSVNYAEEFLVSRFESIGQRHLLASLNVELPNKHTQIKHDKLLAKVNDPFVKTIQAFHQSFNQDRLDLFDIDLYLYQEEHRLHGYRLFSEHDKNDVLGFSMGFFFRNDVLQEEIGSNNCDVDLKLASKYNESSQFSIYLLSGNISSRALFIYLWKLRLNFLAQHSNITEIYINIMQASVADLLLRLGFVIVSTKNETKYGGIKIGNRNYERCIMKLDTSLFLTRKEVISLMRY